MVDRRPVGFFDSGVGGLTVLREVRGWSLVPVLVLSFRADEVGKVAALDAGAQDYVVKPFGMKEFLARVRCLLRDKTATGGPALLVTGDLSSDPAKHIVTQSGVPLHLTRREFDLLWMLASHSDRLITQGMFLKALRGASPLGGQPIFAGLHPPVAPETGL